MGGMPEARNLYFLLLANSILEVKKINKTFTFVFIQKCPLTRAGGTITNVLIKTFLSCLNKT